MIKVAILTTLVSAGAILLTAGAMARLADVQTQAPVVQMVQMDNSGDGLDGRTAVREGNARPYRRGGMRHRRMTRLHHAHYLRRHR